MTKKLKFYKTHPYVLTPAFLTGQSACFDLSFSSAGKQRYGGYNKQNKEFDRPMSNGNIVVMSGDRILVPTGLILDIPAGFSVRVHPRSGLSLKQGLVLANCEGVIDSDYVQELFILIHNTSDNGFTIKNGDRIAQGELVERLEYDLEATMDQPGQKTDRVGGMGSTGIGSSLVNSTFVYTTVAPENAPEKRGPGRPKKAP